MKERRSFVPACGSLEDRIMLSVSPAVEVGKATLAKAAPPSFTAVAISDTQVRLTWTKASGATGYLIEEMVKGRWTKCAKFNKKVTSCVISGLTPNTTYTFDVVVLKGSADHKEVTRSAQTPIPLPNAPPITHPAANGTYEIYPGTLFGPTGGPVYTDVHQINSAAGDCWLLASLAEAAARDPQLIVNMFTDLGNYNENGNEVHLWNVHFYNSSGQSTSVTVDNEFPTGCNLINSPNYPTYDQIYGGVLWVALAEKAYVQAQAMGYVTDALNSEMTLTNTPDYGGLNEGDPAWALQAITGHTATDTPPTLSAADEILLPLNSYLVVVETGPTQPPSPQISSNHTYAVVGFLWSATNNMPFELFNPWNDGDYTAAGQYGCVFDCSYDSLCADFTMWTYAAQ